MPLSVEGLPAHVAMMFRQRFDDQDRELHRIMYISEVHPDDSDLSATAMVKCTVHLFAVDAAEAYALFSNNVPENYPVFMLVSCAPVQPGIPEDSMLEIARGPRPV